MRFKIILLLLFFLGSSCFSLLTYAQGCKDPELRKKAKQVAQAEKVVENELLSIIAHESGCHYYVIAWNLPRKPKTAQSKFFNSLNEAKSFAQSLISTKKYRVDVGIGQINYEAHIRPKGWSLEAILSPKTALNFVASVLKERTWENYHSSNPVYAKKWRRLALAALDRLGKTPFKKVKQKKSYLDILKNSKAEQKKKNLNMPIVIFLNQKHSIHPFIFF